MPAAGMENDHIVIDTNSMAVSQAESEARTLLQRLAHTWGRRACVKQPELDSEMLFDASKDDFVPHLLPFKDHPAFLDVMSRQAQRTWRSSIP